ncbi:MAG: DUF4260 domain-containing protein [Rhodoglobus sp.]
MNLPVWFQRAESGIIAVGVVVAFVQLGHAWWWLPVLFLVFDLSALGYAVSPRVGAWTYNLGHSYAIPVLLGLLGVLVVAPALGLVGLAWAFHIAVDRLLGYGLKFPDRFQHSHLGELGGGRNRTS